MIPGRFDQRTILVTGASSGIGLATAQRLRAEGARVVAVARTETKLRAALGADDATLRVLTADTADEAQVRGLAETLRTGGTVLHGVVHCAGVHALRPLKLLGADDLQRMQSSHVASSVLLCRFLTGTRVLGEGGSVVLLASAAALRGASGTIAYAAAKAGVIAAARCLAIELAGRKIRVNSLSPGVVRTPQSEAFLAALPPDQRAVIEREHPLGLGLPEDVAALAIFLLTDDARWMTGANLVIDGGLTLQ
jgi:NAD(P)-dependent dehydrogenase (short-subunit alcohol dehydrogenase family)